MPSDESCINARLCTPVTPTVTSLAGMKDAFLCESDDYGPMGGGKFQLQTEDQISTSGRTVKDYYLLIQHMPEDLSVFFF